jgi:hypothetical protein
MRLTAPLLMSGISKKRGSLCLWWTYYCDEPPEGNGPLIAADGKIEQPLAETNRVNFKFTARTSWREPLGWSLGSK